MKALSLLVSFLAISLFDTAAIAQQKETSSESVRTFTSLWSNWKFIQDDRLSDDAALQADVSGWQTVSLPHTWNAKDAAGLHITKPYKRGLGWYRLEFPTPSSGARHWLEFGAASMVADVWLNGEKLGTHKGGFTAFRFDVTDRLAKSGRNVLVVKTDNRAPSQPGDPTAIIPVIGDFNVSGGLYRYVWLISTKDAAHIALGDLGGPGVYATTTSITEGRARLLVRTLVENDSATDGDYVVHASLLDRQGQAQASGEQTVHVKARGQAALDQPLDVVRAHLWQGMDDPYLYRLVVELRRGATPLDGVVQDVGLRLMRFDAQKGFFLNGRQLRLRGVAMEQDIVDKGWAVSASDLEQSFSFIKEIGANSVRLGHFEFDPYAYALADRLGLVTLAEVPFTYGADFQPDMFVVGKCPERDASPTLRQNAELQLRETMRQLYNHASVAWWAVGNESTYQSRACRSTPYDNIAPLIRELNGVAKREDPSRASGYADFEEKVEPPLDAHYIATGGITDAMGINQYYLWYSGTVASLGELLDAIHARYPNQALGMTEYGGGGALTHHTDNPLGGPPETINFGNQFPVVYQPEEYQSYLHEQNYNLLESRSYLWGTYAWALFDFGSGVRNEGDVQGVNTKGLVTFDRKVRKDAFFFYKANWSKEPVTYITSRRYTDRVYPVTDVKVYSNADSVTLALNGKAIGTMTRSQCRLMTCVFRNVALRRGSNRLEATGRSGGQEVRDTVEWQMNADGINIAAGQIESGLKSSSGTRFGSDNFFSGGTAGLLVNKNTKPIVDATPPQATRDADLYKNYRRGEFSYYIPLADGTYDVTLGFLEPDADTAVGQRLFDVFANGQKKIENLDVLHEAGKYRTPITRGFTAAVSGGQLKLDFVPVQGNAVVSNLQIHRRP